MGLGIQIWKNPLGEQIWDIFVGIILKESGSMIIWMEIG